MEKISSAMARLDDAAAMNALFAEIPNGEALRAQLKEFRGRARFYYPATRTARYLRMDGARVVCIAVTDVSSAEAEAISDEFDKGFPWNQAALQEVVERVLNAARMLEIGQPSNSA